LPFFEKEEYKMKKRILALFLAMSMLLALVGCSGGTSGTSDTASDETTAGDQAAETSAGSETGEETAATFDGAAANCLYVILQLMQKCGSVDPADVAAEWEKGGQIETIYGTGTIGGEETYGVANHAIGSPRSVSIIDPDAEDGWYFAEWIDTEIP
jgi:hypothetical protein